MTFPSRETFEVISSAQLDFLTLVESGVRPPIAFKSSSSLHCWATEINKLTPISIGRRSQKNVLAFDGMIKAQQLFYRQVWVRADYKSYRRAMIDYFRLITGSYQKIDRYDIDHAVSRKTLKRSWPDAWVNVLFVEAGINRSIGSMMERITATDLRDAEAVLLNAECLLKVFYEKGGKLSRNMIPTYMQEAGGHFINQAEAGATRREAKNVARVLKEIHAEADMLLDSGL